MTVERLGLSLVKELVKLCRGSILLKSQLGLELLSLLLSSDEEAFNSENILDENAAGLIFRSSDMRTQIHNTTLRYAEQAASQASNKDTIVIADRSVTPWASTTNPTLPNALKRFGMTPSEYAQQVTNKESGVIGTDGKHAG